jgi:hypothetical protein
MKGIGDDKAEEAPKKVVAAVAPKAAVQAPLQEETPAKVEKKFEGK